MYVCVCSFRLYITFDFCCFLSYFIYFFVKSLIKYYGSFFLFFLHYFVGIELQDFLFITILFVYWLVVWFV